MKDILIWHYLTIRSDYLEVGDYYCFSKSGDNDIVIVEGISKGKYGYLIKLSLIEVILMRLNGKKKDFVWQVVRKSQRKKHNHHRVLGKYIRNLSNVDL